MQVGSHVPQQQTQLVADDVDLLLGLYAVFRGGLQQELRGDLLQRGDLPLAAAQLLLQSLQQQGATESAGVSAQLIYREALKLTGPFCHYAAGPSVSMYIIHILFQIKTTIPINPVTTC